MIRSKFQICNTICASLTRGASGYSSLLGNLSVYVSLDRQNPHLAFKTLQYHSMWALYDMLEKTIIRNFAEKASVKRKSLQTLRPLHGALSARGLMRRIIRGKPHTCSCVLRNATCSHCYVHLYSSSRTEDCFKDVSGTF